MSRVYKVLAGLILMVSLGSSWAQAAEFDRQHRLFGLVLDRFVKDGLVNYAALKANPRDLNHYLDLVAAVTDVEYRAWDAPTQLAFLCNVYNATTLQLIADNYPIKSIKDIGFLPHAAWRKEVVRLFGTTTTLQALENDYIRAKFPKEPGVHFALVCAAKGCPLLRREPYQGYRLKEQFDDQARHFLADVKKNRVVAVQRTLILSSVFKWYEDDFIRTSGSVINYVRPYLPAEAQEELKAGGFHIEYSDYDWSLNESPPAKR